MIFSARGSTSRSSSKGNCMTAEAASCSNSGSNGRGRLGGSITAPGSLDESVRSSPIKWAEVLKVSLGHFRKDRRHFKSRSQEPCDLKSAAVPNFTDKEQVKPGGCHARPEERLLTYLPTAAAAQSWQRAGRQAQSSDLRLSSRSLKGPSGEKPRMWRRNAAHDC